MKLSSFTSIKKASHSNPTSHVTSTTSIIPRSQRTTTSANKKSLDVTKARLTLDRPRHQQQSPKPLEEEVAATSFLDRGRLGRRWADYQGARNWDGLLNPLDPNLRSEILRYGYFVEAAYRSFDFDPSSPSYATCLYGKKELLEEAGFPDTGYKVTKHLRATSDIQMPRWTERAASWAALQSSWIGYVAVCTDKAEIQRLGRRDVVVALRGTATCLEWLENLRATLTELPSGGGAMVESGFQNLYTSESDTCPSLQDTLREEVSRIMETYKGEELSFTFTGHSLGAALATLAAYDIKATALAVKRAPTVTVISFGGPRVGNRSFRCHVEEQGTKILRVVNPNDVITRLPGFLVDDDDDDDVEDDNEECDVAVAGWAMTSTFEWLQRRVEETSQWCYAEVGCELRLTEPEPVKKAAPATSPMSFNWMNMNFAKCHDLKTYLSLVGSSVVPNCPLRETAKRLLHN